jgi:DNA-binding ferritin-like protein
MDIATLTSLYADLILLHTAEFRWHQKATGEHFHDVHELTEDFYEGTGEHFHMLGERVAALGGDIYGHPSALLEASVLGETLSEEGGDIEALDAAQMDLDAKRAVSSRLGDAIDEFENDAVTEDILIEIRRAQEQHIYLLQQLLS